MALSDNTPDPDRERDLTRLSARERLHYLRMRSQWLIVAAAFASLASVGISVVSFQSFRTDREARAQENLQISATRSSLLDSRVAADQVVARWKEAGSMAQAIPDFKARQAFVDQLSAGVSASQDVSSKITRTLGFFDSIVMNRATQRTDLPFLVQAAHAGGPIVAQPPEAIRHETTIETLKPFVYLAILGAIALFFFGCLGIYAFSGNKEKIKFASDMMKTVVGFWIGIVTGWAGGR